ncbi:MAG: hypothetical protein NC203_05615 [Firmicutes bacterium]|nr:hypothetical protein [[Eubacterium] siraeum]MCM1487829.1 hypothetical protein [Bacillota bacterium]
MKKAIAAITAFILITAALSGCSDGGETQTQTQTETEAAAPEASVAESTAASTSAAETEPAAAEAATTLSNDELTAKLQEVGGYFTGKISKATLNRLYDETSMSVSINADRNPSVLLRLKEASDIPNAAFEMCELYQKALEQAGFSDGTLSISAYDTDDKGYIIDETMIAWRSGDGITGTLVDGTNGEKTENCTADMLYEYFADEVKPFTSEETIDLIKKRMGKIPFKNRMGKMPECLLHEDENAVAVSAAGGSIAVNIRTYEEFLIPAAAEYAYELIIPIAERSELPFGRLNANVYDSDEKGGIVQETMVGWTTLDGATGTFTSKPEGIDKAEMTLEELYEKYGGYKELIEKAINGERVSAE